MWPGCNKQIILYTILLLGCLLSLTGCFTLETNIPQNSANTNNNGNYNAGTGVQGVEIFVEPGARDAVITNAIHSASTSILLEMYLLTDKNIIHALEEAAHRNVDVRVMLEIHPYGSGSISPQKTLDSLQAAGVKAQPTSSSFALTHEKGMVIDSKIVYIMTCNFTLSALGVSKITRNREYGIIDRNIQDVQAVTDIFNADWQHTSVALHNSNLVVSPINSRAAFLSLIDNAQRSVNIEAEEMQDSEIEQALTNASRRGVLVQVILPQPQSNDSNSNGINLIKQGKVEVKEDAQLYMHAKVIITDNQKAFVGSENISTASLERNRELGIIVADPTVLSTLQQTFQHDWSISEEA